MATTHQFLKNFIQRGLNGLDQRINTNLRYIMQRGGSDNVAFNPTAYTGPASTTLAAITPLVITNSVGFNNDVAVVGGRTYRFRAVLPCVIDGTSGGTIDWAGGSATISSFQATGFNYVGSTATLLKTTTLAGLTTNAAAAYTMIIVEGSFVAANGGSFAPRLATFTGTATAPIISAGAYLSLTEVPVSETP